MAQSEIHPYYFSFTKRAFDVVLVLISLSVLAPLFVLLFLMAFISHGTPLFFTQLRTGKNKETFKMYKLRTMFMDADKYKASLLHYNESISPMFKMKNDPRFTPVGKFLSRTGLDELPQLFNILRGEMSFVGPRPLPVAESQQLDPSWDYRYAVKPGIFSEWALSEKKHTSKKDWQKLEKETLYVGSFFVDLNFIFRYLKKLFK